jgi:hypothetical protein
MKWRSSLILVFVVLGLFVSSFSVPKLASAGANFQSIFKATSDDLFVARVGSLPGLSSLTPAEKQAVAALFGRAKGVYEGVFANSSQPEDLESVLLIYYSALGGAINALESGKGSLSPAAQAVINPSIAFLQQEQSSGAKVRSLYTGNVQDPTSRNAENAARTAATGEKPVDPTQKCTSLFNASIVDCADAFITWFIRNTLLQFAGFFLWVSANLLDYVINIGILDFKSWAPEALYPLWQIVRQIISMFVVFSGLWLAFMYIINKSDVFKRYLPWVIIFGLFVNFSYPLTRAAIDLSNVISLNIYASAMGSGYTFKPLNGEYKPSGDSAGAKLMTRLGLQGLVLSASSNDASTAGSADVIKGINGTFPMLLVVGYVLYATYIFFIAAGIIMVRTLALSFVIVASPLLFVDAVIPKLGEAAQKLRKILFEQLAVSIVFMVMLYLSIQMTGAFKNIGGGVSGGTIVQIFNVLMMLIVLHIMLKVTKEVSGSIGQMATNAVGKVGGFATGAAIGAATGGVGLLARGTVGAAAARWSTSEGLLNQQNTFSGRAKLGLANMLANSSYDARNTNAMKVAGNMGGLSKGLGITGRLKTYNENQKDYTAEVARRAGSMTDERARNDYIQSQRGGATSTLQGLALGRIGAGGPQGKMTDAELATLGLNKNLDKTEEEKFQKYASASPEEREKMRLAEKSAIYAKRFEDIDKLLDPKTSQTDKSVLFAKQDDEKLKKIIQNQIVTLATKKTSEQVAEVAKFFNTPEEGRNNLKTFAKNPDEAALYSKLEAYANIKGETGEDLAQKADILVGLGNPALAKAVIGEDTPYKDNKQNQALQNKIQASYNVAAGKALTNAQKIEQAQQEAIIATSQQITNEQTKILEDISKTDFSEMIQRTVKGDASNSLKGAFNVSGTSPVIGGNSVPSKQTTPQQTVTKEDASEAVV